MIETRSAHKNQTEEKYSVFHIEQTWEQWREKINISKHETRKRLDYTSFSLAFSCQNCAPVQTINEGTQVEMFNDR